MKHVQYSEAASRRCALAKLGYYGEVEPGTNCFSTLCQIIWISDKNLHEARKVTGNKTEIDFIQKVFDAESHFDPGLSGRSQPVTIVTDRRWIQKSILPSFHSGSI